jgi:uncharacterized protein YqeY
MMVDAAEARRGRNMSLEERLDTDLKDAMRRGQETRKLAIRAAKTAIMMAKVAGEEARTLTDDEVLAIIARQVKQRRDSITEFAKGGRQDLIDQEQAEIDVLTVYLPAQMDEAAVRARAQTVIEELGVTDLKGVGPVMKRLTAELRGQADGQVINRVVRELLATAGH